MGLFSDPCPQCDARVRKGAKFCSGCGTGAPKGLDVCGNCKSEVSSASEFCWNCGRSLGLEKPPEIRDGRWRRIENQYAVRIDDKEVEGRLVKGFLIEPGTAALILQRGKSVGRVGPGKHDLGGLLSRIVHFSRNVPTTAILFVDGDTTLDFSVQKLFAKGNIPVSANMQLIFRLGDPDSFLVNLMQGRRQVGLDELRDSLALEVQMALAGIVSKYDAEALYGNASLAGQIEESLSERFGDALARVGLEVVRLRFIEFISEAFEAVKEAAGEVEVKRKKTEMVDRAKVDLVEERKRLGQRLRETLTRDRIHAFADGKEFEDFVRQSEHELGMKDVIREVEMEDLKRTYTEKRDDAEIARKHLLEKLDLEHDLVLRRMERADEGDQLEHNIERQRKALEAKQEAEWKEAQQAGRIAEAERETDTADALAGIKILREMNAAKTEAERERQQIEIDRIEALSKLGAEALIAGSDADKAAILAELKKTEMLREFSEEQILAMAASESPDLAEAFKEKFRSAGSVEARAQVGAMYEKMLAEQKEASGNLAEVQQGHAKMLRDLFEQTLSVQGQVASAAAQGGSGPQVVFPPPGSQPTVIAAAGTVKCAACGAQTVAGGAFCEHCGASLK